MKARVRVKNTIPRIPQHSMLDLTEMNQLLKWAVDVRDYTEIPPGQGTIALQSLEGLNRAMALDLWLDAVSAVPHNPLTSESHWTSGTGSSIMNLS